VLGHKSLECFVYSATYDTDEEFLRRYGDIYRANWMQRYHGPDPAAAAALARLKSLL